MRKLLIASAALGIGVGSVLGAPMAGAETISASCTDDGHNLNASADYTTSGSVHRWARARYRISGSGTGGESNVNFRLFEDGREAFGDNSPDDIDQNRNYTVNMRNTPTDAAADEFVTFTAIFDEFGPDDRCTDQTPTV